MPQDPEQGNENPLFNTTFEIETLNRTFNERNSSLERSRTLETISSRAQINHLDKQLSNIKGKIRVVKTKINEDGKKIRIIKVSRKKHSELKDDDT